MLRPLGVGILHEGAFDKTRSYEGFTNAKATFWYTRNVKTHPITEGVKWLYLPLHAFNPFPGVPALRYARDWQVIVAGEPEAKSYRSGTDQQINLDVEALTPASHPSPPCGSWARDASSATRSRPCSRA